ncbi:hypothetical protein HMPREF0724_13814 [Prescottella equi ATCC 33707]|uniref:Uncharacterized protein n=1 Tax=Prescottella equi ATCC 33707 TaxID=525370 RepID=E9T5I6_RHOHA|nr:hypothetical protein HMPREF0724_13814 [Prescottella equi ATCC 33707]
MIRVVRSRRRPGHLQSLGGRLLARPHRVRTRIESWVPPLL